MCLQIIIEIEIYCVILNKLKIIDNQHDFGASTDFMLFNKSTTEKNRQTKIGSSAFDI